MSSGSLNYISPGSLRKVTSSLKNHSKISKTQPRQLFDLTGDQSQSTLACQSPGAAVLSVGLEGGECCGWHTAVPHSECARNGGTCPNSSLVLKRERWECFTPAKTCQYHASSRFSKEYSNPPQLLKWKWENLKASMRFESKREFERFSVPFFILLAIYFRLQFEE